MKLMSFLEEAIIQGGGDLDRKGTPITGFAQSKPAALKHGELTEHTQKQL